MRKIATLFLLSAITNLQAQEIMPIYTDSADTQGLLELSSQNYHASNGFNNDFTNKFILGGVITKEIKDHTLSKLGNVNSIGAESNQTLMHYSSNINPIGGDRYGLVLSVSDNHFMSSNLSTDLYSTAMYGNADFIGDTMDFSFSHLQYLHYQKFGFGLFDKKTKSSLRISYISGSKTLQGRFGNTTLFSQPDSIALSLKGAGFRTDHFYPYLGFQGSGFSIDLNYNFKLKTKKYGDQMINLQVNNLGIIFWNQQSTTYLVDSTTSYTGFDVADFLNQDEQNKEYNFTDTLGIQSQVGNNRTSLPIEFILQKMPKRNHERKLQSIMGFKAILTSDYFPYLYGGIYYAPTKNFSTSTRLSYGGFGGFQWGLDLNYWIKDKVYIGIGSFDMIGNISKTLGYGRSFNISAHFNL